MTQTTTTHLHVAAVYLTAPELNAIVATIDDIVDGYRRPDGTLDAMDAATADYLASLRSVGVKLARLADAMGRAA